MAGPNNCYYSELVSTKDALLSLVLNGKQSGKGSCLTSLLEIGFSSNFHGTHFLLGWCSHYAIITCVSTLTCKEHLPSTGHSQIQDHGCLFESEGIKTEWLVHDCNLRKGNGIISKMIDSRENWERKWNRTAVLKERADKVKHSN